MNENLNAEQTLVFLKDILIDLKNHYLIYHNKTLDQMIAIINRKINN